MTRKRQRVMLSDMTTAIQERIPEIGLGWRLKIALADAGVKAEDMAAELGVSRQTVTRWMTGHGTPPKRVYVKEWAAITGVSLAWLESGHAPHGPSDPPGLPAPKVDQLAALTERKRRRTGGGSPTIGVRVDAPLAA